METKSPQNWKDPNPQKSSRPNQQVLRYSGIAFQMLAFIGLSVWLGIYLDAKFLDGKPIFVIFFTLFGSLGSIYYLYRSLQN